MNRQIGVGIPNLWFILTPFCYKSIEATLSVFDYLIQQASSELNYALLLAIDVVRRSKENNFVIISDSMSSLQSINGFNLDSDLV